MACVVQTHALDMLLPVATDAFQAWTELAQDNLGGMMEDMERTGERETMIQAIDETLMLLGDSADEDIVDAIFGIAATQPLSSHPLFHRIEFGGRTDILYVSAHAHRTLGAFHRAITREHDPMPVNAAMRQFVQQGWGDKFQMGNGCNLVLWPYYSSDEEHSSLVIVDLTWGQTPTVMFVDMVAPLVAPSMAELRTMLTVLGTGMPLQLRMDLIPVIAANPIPLPLPVLRMPHAWASLCLPVLAAFYVRYGIQPLRALSSGLPMKNQEEVTELLVNGWADFGRQLVTVVQFHYKAICQGL